MCPCPDSHCGHKRTGLPRKSARLRRCKYHLGVWLLHACLSLRLTALGQPCTDSFQSRGQVGHPRVLLGTTTSFPRSPFFLLWWGLPRSKDQECRVARPPRAQWALPQSSSSAGTPARAPSLPKRRPSATLVVVSIQTPTRSQCGHSNNPIHVEWRPPWPSLPLEL